MSAGIAGSLRHLPPIGLEELSAAAALQTRVDRKYVLPALQARQLLGAFEADLRILEMDGKRAFDYDSVYFDTPQLDSYLLAARGRRRRFKIRTRTYVDSAVSFLEVKTEGSREATVKDRIPYHLADRSRITAEGLAYINDTLTETIGAVPPGPLEPVLETRYRRTTLFLPGSDSRATLDEAVTWQRPGGRPWLLDGSLVLETKSGSTAGPLDRLLWDSGIRPSRISKFATGMAALCPELPANRWHRTLQRHLNLTPAAAAAA